MSLISLIYVKSVMSSITGMPEMSVISLVSGCTYIQDVRDVLDEGDVVLDISRCKRSLHNCYVRVML